MRGAYLAYLANVVRRPWASICVILIVNLARRHYRMEGLILPHTRCFASDIKRRHNAGEATGEAVVFVREMNPVSR